jgi:chorismate mutase / prephenate dehydratase
MNLPELRNKIDQLDAKIMQLLNERTELALEVGRIKSESGKEVYAPERESEIYQKIDREAKGPLPKSSLKSIYREIMSAALAIEKPLVIAYLGQEVEQKRADYGVIPVENSIEGAVSHSLDMFMESELKICSEILFEISHHLMSNSEKKHIKRIYSNPQVFGQCRLWLETHMPGVDLIDTASTTAAAQKAQKEEGSAAIGSKLAATLYNLPVLNAGIQDFSQNMTRFLVVSRQSPPPSGRDKTSVLVSIKDKVGALFEMLAPIRKYKINMTKIESRPSKKKAWDYFFFIDFEGHADKPNIKKMLGEMEGKVKFLKVLGSYPASTLKET